MIFNLLGKPLVVFLTEENAQPSFLIEISKHCLLRLLPLAKSVYLNNWRHEYSILTDLDNRYVNPRIHREIRATDADV